MKNFVVFVFVGHEITAVWPFQDYDQNGEYKLSYANIGQHGPIHPNFLASDNWVKDHSYLDLAKELKDLVGYEDMIILNDTSGENSNLFPHIQRAFEDWTKWGILKEDGSLCSKTKFSKIIDWHQYGNGNHKRYIGFAYSNAKESLWGFYNYSSKKKDCIDNSYERLRLFIQGYTWVIGGAVQWTDKGIPLTCRSIHKI